MMNGNDTPRKDKKKKNKKRKSLSPEKVDSEKTVEVSTKKSKKKKRTLDETEVEETQLNESFSSEVSKKKKKKDKEKNINNNEVKNASPLASPVSGGKKKKRSLVEQDDTLDDESISLPSDSPLKRLKLENERVTEEEKILIEAALEQTQPARKAYSAEMSNLNYEQISSRFEFKSAEECKEELKVLIEKIPKTKCLHQVLEETLKDLPQKKRVNNSFTVFIAQNKDAINKAIAEGKGSNKLTAAAYLWKELSGAGRWHYQQQANIYSSLNKEDKGKSPCDIFFIHLKKKNPNINITETRKKWQGLKVSKKVKYIEKSIEIMRDLEEAEKLQMKLREEEGEVEVLEPKSPTKLKGPTKMEIALYLKFLNVPEMPEKLPALLFYKTELGDTGGTRPKDFLLEALREYKALDNKTKEEWNKRHLDSWKSFRKHLEEWKKGQNENTLYLFEKTFGELSTDGASKKPRPKRAPAAASPVNQLLSNLVQIEMPISQVKFSKEPIAPPLTVSALFKTELAKATNEKVSPAELKKRFQAIDKERKSSLEKKLIDIRAAYIRNLRLVVAAMPLEQRKLFLGLRRDKYIKLLKEDVFEEKYPCREFPLYVKSLNALYAGKKDKGESVKSKGKSSKPAEVESEVEVEDEEEEVQEETEEEEEEEEEKETTEEEEEEEEKPVKKNKKGQRVSFGHPLSPPKKTVVEPAPKKSKAKPAPKAASTSSADSEESSSSDDESEKKTLQKNKKTVEPKEEAPNSDFDSDSDANDLDLQSWASSFNTKYEDDDDEDDDA